MKALSVRGEPYIEIVIAPSKGWIPKAQQSHLISQQIALLPGSA